MLCIKYAINFSTHQTHLSFVIRVATPWHEFELPHYILTPPPITHILDPITICSKCRYEPDSCICCTWTNSRQLLCTLTKLSVLWHLDIFIQEAVLFRPEKLPILLWCDTVSLIIWFPKFWDDTVLSQHQGPHTQWGSVILKELIPLSLSLSLSHIHTHTHTHTHSLLQKPKKSPRSENIGIFVILRVFFYSCVDGNSQDPERERRPFSRMSHHTHPTCVSTGCKRELLLASAQCMPSVRWYIMRIMYVKYIMLVMK